MLAELYAFIAAALFVLVRFAHQGKVLPMLGASMRLLVNPFLPASKRRPVVRETMTELRFGPAIFAGVLGTTLLEWNAK